MDKAASETIETGPADNTEGPSTRRRRWPWLLGAAVVLVVLGGVVLWWFFIRDDSPERADIDTARETLGDSGGEVESSSEGEPEIDGTWTVDTNIGSFDYGADDFSGTWAGYRIDEELASVGATTAVGRTPDVTGTLSIDGDQVTEASFEVDMTTLESDQDFRDNRLQDQGLETDAFPTASFELTEPIDLPDDAAAGETLAYDANGELTLHGVTQDATMELEAFFDGEAVVIVASAPIVLDDYDIEKPSATSVVSISDEGEFEIQAFLTRS